MKQEMTDHIQIICSSLDTDNHTSTSSVNFLQVRCSSSHPTNNVKKLKTNNIQHGWATI